MEFRWVAAIALWTILSGPIFNGRSTSSTPIPEKASATPIREKPAVARGAGLPLSSRHNN